MTGSGNVGGSSVTSKSSSHKRVTGGDVAQTDQRGDVAGINFVDVLAFAALNDHEAADAFAFARARIVNRVALFQLAGINAEEHQLARVRIGPKFERERTEFVVVVGLDLDVVFRAGFMTFGAGNVQRAGQIIHDGIHQDLHAFFLERGTAQHGNEFNLAGQTADGRLEHRRRQSAFLPEPDSAIASSLLETASINSASAALARSLMFGGNVRDLVIQDLRWLRPGPNKWPSG